MAGVKYVDRGFPFYNQDFPDMQSEQVKQPTKKFTDFGLDLGIRVCAPPAWTLASELSEQKRIEFTSQAQSMLDDYNKIKDTNFEFVRLVRVQTYLSIENDHYIQFEAKPSGAADHTLKTFEAAIYEQFYPTPEVFPVTCKLVVPN
ncbi:uncharacterized protein LOC112000521 [Quercus suber]|uniref:Uncharacterized protein n=1 Tax=Quercus suber TaxID=58331 RepID=A0AAW0JXM6_QUESU|nr:uncharacterized protein LOC112000521 [Quercus suber]XP_023888443.1 uncharacterized protein LOC112000521 [Quercus suber]XP_023888444.1 uncharacterized protein LOC112000521 [Quercus suber]